MQDFIGEIYNYAELIPNFKEVLLLCNNKNYGKVKEKWESIIPVLNDFCNKLSLEDSKLSGSIMDRCVHACQHTTSEPFNYSLFSDELSEVIPLLFEGMKNYSTIDVTDKQYRLLSSKSGFLSLMNVENGKVYHSLIDPVSEACELAKNLFFPTYLSFHFVGCGLGYLPREVFSLSDMSEDIFVYGTDTSVLQYAIDYGYLGLIPENKLHIVICNTENDLLKELNKFDFFEGANGLYLGEEALDTLSKDTISKIQDMAITCNSLSEHDAVTNINIFRNEKNVGKTIYDVKKEIPKKEWIVAVAGPSLDNNLEYIKKNVGKKTIICASTVYKKLLSNSIIPDYVCVCDPLSRTFGHFEGTDNKESTLLLDASANWRFAEFYKGEKLLVPTAANRTGYDHFEAKGAAPIYITGSVSYMCVKMAYFFKASKIHLCGLDLSYPTEKSHASGTMDEHKVNKEKMIVVPCVLGGTVPTTVQFLYYIKTMNELFNSMENVKIINHSDMGAAFENTLWYKEETAELEDE